ncbi:MAG: hypothetical protein MHM6MM_000733 [Cercozoa sp. M6MM]
MRNHSVVPTELVMRLSGTKRGECMRVLSKVHKYKLIKRERKSYEGWYLTYRGYDYLALNVFKRRGLIRGLGTRIGVGKESDIYQAQGADGRLLVLKLHRLGRTSFRKIKEKRDYHEHRQSVNWLYLSRLSATREFAFMRALYQHEFPVPVPVDQNRHCVLMHHVNAYPLCNVGNVSNPGKLYDKLMSLIVKFAEHGLVHCDFNEFNLLVSELGDVTVIDFPQMVSTRHKHAQEWFERDVQCVKDWFLKRCQFEPVGWPEWADDVPALPETRVDAELKASGYRGDGEDGAFDRHNDDSDSDEDGTSDEDDVGSDADDVDTDDDGQSDDDSQDHAAASDSEPNST